MKILFGTEIVKKYEETGLIDPKLGEIIERNFKTNAEEEAYWLGVNDALGNNSYGIVEEK